jgi:hypothetical protein
LHIGPESMVIRILLTSRELLNSDLLSTQHLPLQGATHSGHRARRRPPARAEGARWNLALIPCGSYCHSEHS